jgi:hypothetical protein
MNYKIILHCYIFVLLILTASSYFTVNITQSRCWIRPDSGTSAYPDGTTDCAAPTDTEFDDDSYEQVGATPNTWNSIRTSHNYVFPNYCNLLDVAICIDFYTGNQQACNATQVTRNGGALWSSSQGTCPTVDSGIVCYDVTSTLLWASNCSDFWNNQSETFFETQAQGNNPLFVDYIAYRINYTTPPNVTRPEIISTASTLNCTINATDAEESPLTVNFTWYQNGVRNASYDSEVICINNTECFTSVLIPYLSPGESWICSVIATDSYTFSNWRNSSEFTVPNSVPFINNVDINNQTLIDLFAAQNRTVMCNGTLTEYEGFSDIVNVNATLYSNGTGITATDPDNRANHYTNTSCSFTNNPGSEQIFTCAFSIDYYAVNGSWACNVTVIDTNTSFNSSLGSTVINPLIAIGVSPSIINYGELGRMQISPSDIDVNVTNYGNVQLDLNLSAYALYPNDNISMDCTTGNISLSLERFSENSGDNFNLMTAVNNSLNGVYVDFNLPKRDGGAPESRKSVYWKLQIPSEVSGQCNGKVVFTAMTNY